MSHGTFELGEVLADGGSEDGMGDVRGQSQEMSK